MKGFSKEGNLYLPEIYGKAYKNALIRDYGLGGSISRSFLYGRKIKSSSIFKFIENYDFKKLLFIISQLSKQLSLRGQKLIKEDDLQQDLYSKALEKGADLGLKLNSVDQSELENSGLATPETINGIICLLLSNKVNGTQDPFKDFRNFAFACICINDHAIGHTLKFKGGSANFYFENLRKIWFSGAFLGSTNDFSPRLYRFVNIHNLLLNSLKPNIRKLVRECFRKKWGVTIERFIWLSYAVFSNHLGGNPREIPILKCNPLTQFANRVLARFLKRISLPPRKYKKELKTLLQNVGVANLQEPIVTKFLINKPFIEIQKNEFLLLGPHLLLRLIELSVKTAFYDKKPKEIKNSIFLGPYGECAEKYAQNLIENCVKKSRGTTEGTIERPKTKGGGPGDLVILHPDLTIVFEIKFRQPPFSAFNPGKTGLDKFKNWFNECYTTPPPRPGALHQLARDCDAILNKKLLGISVKKILPVIVNPEDLIFSYDFYEIIQKEIRKIKFYQDSRVLPILAMGIGDLEYIYGLDFGEKGNSFSQILKEKATHPAGRLTSWMQFLRNLNFKYKLPEVEIQNLMQLKDTAGERLQLI